MNTEINLSAFVYRLYHQDFSPILGTNFFHETVYADKLTSVIFVHKALHNGDSIEHSTTCDSRTKFN